MALEHCLKTLESFFYTLHVIVTLALAHDVIEIEAGRLSHGSSLSLVSVHLIHIVLTGVRSIHHVVLLHFVVVAHRSLLPTLHLTIVINVTTVLILLHPAILLTSIALTIIGMLAIDLVLTDHTVIRCWNIV